jgi:hypothetical protein
MRTFWGPIPAFVAIIYQYTMMIDNLKIIQASRAFSRQGVLSQVNAWAKN